MLVTIYWCRQAAAEQPDLAEGRCPDGLLNTAEQAALAILTYHKRRRDWLLGRCAAKRLLQALLAAGRCPVALDALAVVTNEHGAPAADWPGSPPRWVLSLSHSHGVAVAAAADRPRAVFGLDLEHVEPRPDGFVEDFFTPAEAAQVHRLSADERPLYAAALWSAREAALKALQTGLRADTRAISCRLGPSPAAGNWAPFDLSCDPRRLPGAPPLYGWWRRMDGFVLALVAEAGQAAGRPHEVELPDL